MSFVSTIGVQKTPGNPVNVLLGPQTGLPAPLTTLVLVGAMGASGGPTGGGTVSGTATAYTQVSVTNIASLSAASAEVATKFGQGSTLALMVLAAVTANAAGPNFPPITCVPLPLGATGFGGGSNNQALLVVDKIPGITFVATQFDGSSDATNRAALIAEVTTMSGAARCANAQYGAFCVMANTTQATYASLPQPNTQNFIGIYLYDSSGNPYTVGQLASAAAAVIAANPVPYNGLDTIVIPGVTAPVNQNDWITVGVGLQSESILTVGWTPLRVLPNATVAFVRTVTSRLYLSDGVTSVTAYYDVQDFQVLYFFRETVAVRFAQPDFINQKASIGTATAAKGVIIGLMQTFQDQGMFQGVSQLARQVIVQTNQSQLGRFDIYIPVTVVPNLHMIATDVVAGTQYDFFTVGAS